jgi:hypothetical protein
MTREQMARFIENHVAEQLKPYRRQRPRLMLWRSVLAEVAQATMLRTKMLAAIERVKRERKAAP